jgi:AcrR family transcriptional regulator
MTDAKPKGRPAAADATPKALKATQRILLTEGFARLSIEKIASLTGLGKPTLYRRWSNASELAMAALLAIAPEMPKPKGPSFEAGLLAQMTELVMRFDSRWGSQVVLVVAASDPKAEASRAFVETLLLSPRTAAQQSFEAAIAAGEISAPPDLDLLLDMLFAPILSRLLLGHRGMNADFAAGLVKTALMACAGQAPKVTRPAKAAKAATLLDLIEEPRQGSLF